MQTLTVKAVILLAIILFSAHILGFAQNSLMKKQADNFLKNMPTDLQHKQAEAIKKAISGDNSDLEAVRHSRNTAPSISANVHITDLSPTLRLYEPICASDSLMPLLVYFHGGGWTFGSLNSCGRFCDAMAATGKMKVLAVDYRLAPEHPYPCGLNDCQDAIIYAHDNATSLNIDVNSISAGGDSSGGNLAIATALSSKCQGILKSLIVFYPVTKAFADGSASWKKYGSGYALDTELMNEFNNAYIGTPSIRKSLVDVGLNASDTLRKLPKTLLIAAERDILCDQGAEFASKAGSDIVTRVEFSGAVHLFITVPGQDAAFHRAIDLASKFISK